MLTLLDMPKRPSQPAEETVTVSARVQRKLRDRLLAIGASTDFDLTLSQLVETAIKQYVERAERELPRRDAKRG